MNRLPSLALCVVWVALIFCFAVNQTQAQEAPPAAPPQEQVQKPVNQPSEKGDKGDEDEMKDLFAPEPAPTLRPGMTGSDANDPRAKLAPGLYDAGEASLGIQHLLLVKKPDAFQLGTTDPDDPKVDKIVGQLGMGSSKKIPKPAHLLIAQLAFANSDLAFQGNHLFQGNFYGVSIYDISHPANAALLTSIVCPGGQGDVSVYKNLMFMSVEMPNGRLDCGVEGFPPEPPPPADEDKDKDKDKNKVNADDKDKVSADDKEKDKEKGEREKEKEKKHRIPVAQKDRFRGVRVFDISDIKNPKQVAAVQTCRGSHTHTLVTDPRDKDNVYIYVSGTSFVRQPEELAGCSGEKPDKDPNTALFRIDVIKVPVAAPQEAKVVSSPRIFIDPRTGAINGLNNGGTHGKKGAAKPAGTDRCHALTGHPARAWAPR